jgi:sugar phosphate isomerase/epimerase
MVKVAFSTIACPTWTLDRVADAAERWGYQGVELRTFGPADTRLACEPALTGREKVRSMFARAGVAIAGVATGARFDAPVFPPVMGWAITDTDKSVVQAKRCVEIAHDIGAPHVRVFGFERQNNERWSSFIHRVATRLRLVVDSARHMDTTIVVENAGSFATAERLTELLDRVNLPICRACYNLVNGLQAGDDPMKAVSSLGYRLAMARVKDLDSHGMPVPLGEGVQPVREFVAAVAKVPTAQWLVYEWDRLWIPDIAPAEDVLPGAAEMLIRAVARAQNLPGSHATHAPAA